ncbi:pimeloyl-ACP methyl ester carboxylesterase [Bradyrhizobium sp. LM6.11]
MTCAGASEQRAGPTGRRCPDISQGVQLARLQSLCGYWAKSYDWRKIEKQLNALPQFITEIDGLDIHFIHVRSRNPDALPIIITHGWPGSILEMLKTIGPLTDPVAHGGRAEDAFRVVIPSIPGYGFSAKPRELGWGPDRVARAWDVLMKRLGYVRYVSQGGDHGSVISDALARQKPAGLLGIHVNMPPTVPAEYVRGINAGDPPPAGLPEPERVAFETLSKFFARSAAYGAMMVTRPQTIGYGLCDSPATLAAFMYEKIAEWTDSGGEPERVLTKDEILDAISLYWLTDTGASASRFYWENNNNNFSSAAQKTTEITVPVAVSVFPAEIYRAPKTWTQRAYPTLHYFNEVEKGRPLRCVGAAAALRRRDAGGVQITALGSSIHEPGHEPARRHVANALDAPGRAMANGLGSIAKSCSRRCATGKVARL